VIRTGLLIAAKALAAVVVADALAFLFRAAAFFGLLPFLGSLGVVVLLTRRERRAARSQPRALTMIIVLWLGVWFAVWFLVFGRTSRELVEMSWKEAGTNAQFHQAEVLLESVQRPDWAVGFVSDELEQYLSKLGPRRVAVTFEVTRDFGCARSFRGIRIGALTGWRYAVSYGRYGLTAIDPWKNPIWCRTF
jgi:hypothetical protein